MADETTAGALDLSRSISIPPQRKSMRKPFPSIQSTPFTPVRPVPLAHFNPPKVFYPLSMINLNPPVPQFYQQSWNPNSYQQNQQSSSPFAWGPAWNDLPNSPYGDNYNHHPYPPAPPRFEAIPNPSWNYNQSQFSHDHLGCPLPGISIHGNYCNHVPDFSRTCPYPPSWDHHTSSGHNNYSNYGPFRPSYAKQGVFQNQNQRESCQVIIQEVNNQNDGEKMEQMSPSITTPDSSIDMNKSECEDFKLQYEGRMSTSPCRISEEEEIDVVTVSELPGDATILMDTDDVEDPPQAVGMNGAMEVEVRDYASDSPAEGETTSKATSCLATKIHAYDKTENVSQKSEFTTELSQGMGTETEKPQAAKPTLIIKMMYHEELGVTDPLLQDDNISKYSDERSGQFQDTSFRMVWPAFPNKIEDPEK